MKKFVICNYSSLNIKSSRMRLVGHAQFYFENLKVKDLLVDADVDGKIILKYILINRKLNSCSSG
jgi:hypothetical protein